jgi:branched-chain amino acid aminotransferase
MDGRLLEDPNAVPALAHGLHYGTGVFEGIRCYPTAQGPAIFRLREHMDRLRAGADALGMRVDVDAMTRACVTTVAASGAASAYLRPLAYFARGGLTLDVGALQASAVVAVLPWSSHLGDKASREGIRAHVCSIRRVSAAAVPPLKLCGNYVNSILAKRESTAAGCDEALFVDDAGFVCEATGENVFLVRRGSVVAVEHRDALPGITRRTVLELSGGASRPVSLEELLEADEVFVTGTSAEVTPVARIGSRTFGVGPVTRSLQALYLDAVHGRLPDRASWLTLTTAA